MTLSVIGLGKLGSPLLAVLANAGFSVVGVDSDPAKVDAINAGKAPVEETDLQEWLERNRHLYKATLDVKEAILHSSATFVIVPTPSGADGGFMLDYLTPVMHEMGAALREKSAYHLVIIVSTVMPGQTRECCTVLEEASGKREGVDFGLVYSPTFIALGSVIKNLTQPDYVLVGSENEKACDALIAIYRKYLTQNIVTTNWVSAEISKIAQNAFITMKIAFANDLGRLCDYIHGANVTFILDALGRDRRVGLRFLQAGTAPGGPCLPRDSRAFEQVYERAGVPKSACLSIREIVDVMNDVTTDHLWRIVEKEAGEQGVVGVLGLAYKPGTSVCEESASLALIDRLLANPHRRVVVWDPLAMQEAQKELGCAVEYAENVDDCVRRAEVVVLMHPMKDLLFRDKIVIDPWRVMWGFTFNCRKYVPLGVGQ